jgi:hypothetical protein
MEKKVILKYGFQSSLDDIVLSIKKIVKIGFFKYFTDKESSKVYPYDG